MSEISVVLPNKDYGKYLPQALEALLAQERLVKEILIYDDASEDNSREIIKNYSRTSAKFKIFYHKKTKGVAFILNDGLRRAKGDYIYFASSDDFIEKDFFLNASNALKTQKDFGVLCGGARLFSSQNKILGYRPATSPFVKSGFVSAQEVNKAFIKVDNFLIGNCCIYDRKKLLDIGGFVEEIGSFTDGVAMRALAINYGAIITSDVCVNVRVHESNYSKVNFSTKEQTQQFFETSILAKNLLKLLITDKKSEYPYLYAKRCLFFSLRVAIKNGDISSGTFKHFVLICRSEFRDLGSPLLVKKIITYSKTLFLIQAFLVFRPYRIIDFVLAVTKSHFLKLLNLFKLQT